MSDIENDINDLEKILILYSKYISDKIISIYNSDEKSLLYNIVNDHIYYYSSYQNIINISKRKHIWCSHIFSQTLLHVFDQIRTQKPTIIPHIYRFKFNRQINLIKSFNKNNINIFEYIFNKEINDKIRDYFIKKYNDSLNMIYSGEKNIRILLILQIINEYLPENMRFDGYYNEFDQNETAFINDNIILDIVTTKYVSIKLRKKNKLDFPCTKKEFEDIITHKPIYYTDIINIIQSIKPTEQKKLEEQLVTPIVKHKFESFVFDNFDEKLEGLEDTGLGGLEDTRLEDTGLGGLEDTRLEDTRLEDTRLGDTGLGGLEDTRLNNDYKLEIPNDKFRMICNNNLIEYIEYIDFDTKNTIQYICLSPREYYFEQKYLKYKKKYLQIKKLI
jgi:hypothetical protein